jgi:hypothetical protein
MLEEQRRKAEDDAKRQADFDKAKRDALSSMKGIADSEFGGLKGISADKNTGLKDRLKGISSEDHSGLKGLDDTRTLFSKPTPGDAPVDTRVKGPSNLDVGGGKVPTGLPKSVEDSIPQTPAGDRVRKALEAIQTHDWKVAAAWFQDALNHQPGDPGLKRLVDLAQYTLQKESQNPNPKPAGPDARDLGSAWDDYNQNFFSKHPSLSDEEFFKQEDPAWKEFFRYVTSKLFNKLPGELPPLDANGIRG